MDYPMRRDLRAGERFPDFELPDHTGVPRRLSQLLRSFPGMLTFNPELSRMVSSLA
jgi:peroxiredoxin